MGAYPLRLMAVAVGLGVALLPGTSEGQTLAEIRGGYTVGSHSGTAAGLDMAPAISYEAFVIHRLTPLFSVYGGYSRTSFGCEEGFCLDRDLTVTGNQGVLGAEARKAWAWARLGMLFGKTEVGTEGEAPDMGPGIHFGAGFTVGAGRLTLRPGFSLRRMSASTPSSSDHAVALSGEVGVAYQFGGGANGGD